MAEKDAKTWQEYFTALCSNSELEKKLYPSERANDPWESTDQDVELAWVIYTELRTRIATQDLPLRDGVESSALNSLVDLFALIRREVASRPLALNVASFLVHCLNRHVRPFTARWHAKTDSNGLATLDQRFSFRAELIQLQIILRAVASVLGQISGDKDAVRLLAPSFEHELNDATSRGQITYGIKSSGQYATQIEKLNEAERQLIIERRGLKDSKEKVQDAVGLAISGGGIRSATFSLGVVQVLTRRGVMRDVDVMSTVSGGSYLGSFITSVLSVDDKDVGLGADQQPFACNDQVESQPIRYLRNHSKYLSEGGFRTLMQMIFSVAYGVIMSLLLVAPVILFASFIFIYVFGLGPDAGWIDVQAIPDFKVTLTWIICGLLGVVIIWLSILRNPSRGVREKLEKCASGFLLLGIALGLIQGIPALYDMTNHRSLTLFFSVLLLPLFLGVIGLWCGANSILGRVVWALFVLVGPLFFLSLLLVCIDFVIYMRGWSPYLPGGVIVFVFLHSWFLVNINFASLHLYYRDRLARTYMRRVGMGDAEEFQPLSKVNSSNKVPLHLINAAANLPASKNPELRGRNTDFFFFAKHFCGGPTVGWWPTEEWEKQDQHLDLGTAMAISGAAAAPRMGTFTSAKYITLLAMLNVRLGYWLRKPGANHIWRNTPGGRYFLKELTGNMNEDLPFINVSDGGHIENLGVYELLRRRCRYIVAIDGEADPEHTFGGLLNAIRMAKIDLGVQMEPDLTDLRNGADYFKRSHFVLIRIDYGVIQNDLPVYGLLLVIKLALTGNESELLMQYHRDYPTFPHQSTAQQLFTEAQFEAYRALGEHAADAAFDKVLTSAPPTCFADWLQQLERKLLPREG